MNLDIPELQTILNELKEVKEKLNQNEKDFSDMPAWLNDQQCWQLKGGMALNTYRNNRFYQVKGGIPDGYVGGRKVWKKESVLEWLPLTDKELEAYHLKYKTGAKTK